MAADHGTPMIGGPAGPALIALCAVMIPATPARVWGAEREVASIAGLDEAIAAARPGDVVVVRDGRYADWRIDLRGSGREDAPIELRPRSPGGVEFGGRTRVTIEGSHLVVSGFVFDRVRDRRGVSLVEFRGARSCRLTACSFLGCGDPASTFTRTINLAHGSRHNRVDHCFMTGTLSMGMGVEVRDRDAGRGNTDNRFDHNHFKSIERLSANGQEPIQLGQDQSAFGEVPLRSVVEWNLFERADGDSEIISNKSADNVIRYNTMRDSEAGLCLRGGCNVRVEGNCFLRTRGMRVFGRGHVIVNNYFEATTDGIGLPAGQYRAGGFVDRESSGSYEAASDVLVAHNTIVNPANRGIDLGRDLGRVHDGVAKREVPRGIEIVGNVVVGERGTLCRVYGAENIEWAGNIARASAKAKIGLADPGIRSVDPGLVRADGIRRLASAGSAARDACPPRSGLSLDFDLQPRDGRPDAGCDEWVAGGAARRPLQPSDVGPPWMDAR